MEQNVREKLYVILNLNWKRNETGECIKHCSG